MTRARVEFLFGTVVWTLLGGTSLAAPVARGEAQVARARAVTTFDAAAEIQRHNGPRIVLLYSSTCPESRAMFPAFVEFAGRHAQQGVAGAAKAEQWLRSLNAARP